MLTDELASQITMFMRVANLLQKNLPTLQEHPEIIAHAAKLKDRLAEIFEQLSDEEQDLLLEQYREEAAILELRKR